MRECSKKGDIQEAGARISEKRHETVYTGNEAHSFFDIFMIDIKKTFYHLNAMSQQLPDDVALINMIQMLSSMQP